MDFLASFKICASGLAAQRAKMDVVTSNLANVNTTRTPEGGPYKRQVISFSTEPVKEVFQEQLKNAVRAVKVNAVVEDKEGMKAVYDPAHPDADPNGQVTMPNVNVVLEMTDMIAASRAYEATVTAFDSAKAMAVRALDIGRQ